MPNRTRPSDVTPAPPSRPLARMHSRLREIVVCCCALASVLGFARLAVCEDPIYTASFADGTYVTDGRIGNWHDTGAQPNLNGKNLFDATAPVRWLISNSNQQVLRPDAFVEFVGGDRLPGRVQEFRHGAEDWRERLPPHLVVKPGLPIDLPGKPERTRISVRTDSLRRVVWQRRASDRYQPGTLFYLDGRETTFRSLRWSNGAVLILQKEGTRRVPFAEIAEIHLPQRDGWDAYFDMLAELTPDISSRLMRAATFNGLVATTSLERFRATAFSGDPNSWYHMLQPAWSLDPLWIQHASIRARRVYLPQEVPLSIIEPVRTSQKSIVGMGWTWQADRNVRGESLRCGGKQFGWGLGMQARSELAFTLPAVAKSFRAWVGLDEAVGRGGCARAALFVNAASGQPLWQSQHLIGSSQAVDTGAIALAGPAAGQKFLVLVADPAHADRPAGADPFDIRDMVDWLVPQLELDTEKLKAEVAARSSQIIPAWQDWKVAIAPGAKLIVNNRYDNTRPIELARNRHETIMQGGPFVASRTWTVTPEQKYLVLGIYRYADVSQPSRIEVRVNGNPLTDAEVPERRAERRESPLLVSLERFVGQEINVELVHIPTGDQSRIEWRSLETAAATTPVPWTPLTIVELKSSGGTKLEAQYDGTILASGDVPAQESYTVSGTTDLQGITALRFDAIPDPRMPNNGTGRYGDGTLEISDVKLTVAPAKSPEQSMSVPLDAVTVDHEVDANYQARYMVDENPQSGWTTWPKQNEPHAIVFAIRHDIGQPGGARLNVSVGFNNQQRSAGRFLLSVSTTTRPVPLEMPALVVPHKHISKARILFDEDESWMRVMQGSAKMFPVSDHYSGRMALRVDRERRWQERLPEINIPIRKNPGPGEMRYLRWAWKKVGGETIVLEIAHDGAWGQAGNNKFRYQTSPAPVRNT